MQRFTFVSRAADSRARRGDARRSDAPAGADDAGCARGARLIVIRRAVARAALRPGDLGSELEGRGGRLGARVLRCAMPRVHRK